MIKFAVTSVPCRYQTGLAIKELGIRKTLEKLKKRLTCMLLKLPLVVVQQVKSKDNLGCNPLLKVCVSCLIIFAF